MVSKETLRLSGVTLTARARGHLVVPLISRCGSALSPFTTTVLLLSLSRLIPVLPCARATLALGGRRGRGRALTSLAQIAQRELVVVLLPLLLITQRLVRRVDDLAHILRQV